MAQKLKLHYCEVFEKQVSVDEDELTSPSAKSKEAIRAATLGFLNTLLSVDSEDATSNLADAFGAHRVYSLKLSPKTTAILLVVIKFRAKGSRPPAPVVFLDDWHAKAIRTIDANNPYYGIVHSPAAKILRSVCVVDSVGLLTMYLYDENEEEMYRFASSLQDFESRCNNRSFHDNDDDENDEGGKEEVERSINKLLADFEVSVVLRTKQHTT